MTSAIGSFAIGVDAIGVGAAPSIPALTPANLIRLAMLTSGAVSIDKTIYAEEMYVALDMLSGLLAQWQRRRWLVWALADTAIISTGAQSYTIGPSADFDVARPDRIDSAFARLLVTQTVQGPLTNTGGVVILPPGNTLPTSPTGLPPGSYWNNGGVLMVVPGGAAPQAGTGITFLDFPLAIIQSREDYNSITLKGLTTFPSAVFYDSAYPLGTLFFWPIPNAQQWELHVTTKTTLPAALNLSTGLVLPPEYQQALVYTLACMMRPQYGMGPEPTLIGQARAAMNTIRQANAQIPEMGIPAALLPGVGRGGVAAGASQGFQSGWMT